MVKSKKISIFILMLMLALSSILFVACGKQDYSNVYLSSSQTYIEMFKDEERNVTITIENPVKDMNNSLTYTLSNPTVCELDLASKHGMSTTYTITAKNGGNTTIDFVSLEGNKSFSVNVYVKEFSAMLQAGENGLYVSKSTKLIPSSADFVFDDNSTERDLSYYFYGKNNVAGSLTLEDVKNGEEYKNNFVDVQLYTDAQQDNYLIFKDKQGLYFTLGFKKVIAGSENVSYQFLSVEKTKDGFKFDVNGASKVNPGDSFTFIAEYNNELSEEPVFCERTFSVVIDINEEDVSHEYGYKIVGIDYQLGRDNTSYKIEELKNGNITLIPNYISPIKNPLLAGYSANYLTAYVEVAIKNLNEFLKVNINVKDKNIASSKVYGSYQQGEYTIYVVELNCGIGSEQLTSLDVNLYYDGFESSEDSNVNYTYSIPVEIHVIPTKLLVNNIDLASVGKTYRFYNTYANESFGWQPFNFTVVPEGAKYDKLYIDLTNSDLQVRYMNVIYTTGQLEITNLNETIYVKGATNAALSVENKKLPINLDFSVIESDTIASYLEYSIVKGPSPLKYKTDEFKNKIYVELSGGDVLFDDIFTDAEFASMTFTHVSGSDIVNFKYDSNKPFIQDGLEYKLNLYISPKVVGNGTYTISLDNGEQIAVNIEVKETLNSLSVSTKDENNVIKLIDTTFEDDRADTLIYLYNGGGKTSFDFNIIANGSKSSTAIEEILPDIQSPNISLTQLVNQSTFVLYVEQVGTMNVLFSVEGYQIENFKRQAKTLTLAVKIISYDYIGRLNVYKLSDGFNSEYAQGTSASYANVYSNTYNESARKIKLDIGIQNPNGYLFANPSVDKYIDSLYQHDYLYFESDAIMYKDEDSTNPVDLMYYSPAQSNIYILKGNLGDIGTFDTQTLTFTAFSNLQVNTNLKLIAHIKQYGKTYSYTINISIKIYEMVEGITLQTAVSEIEFSALNRETSLIAYPVNKTATDGEIVAIFIGGQIELVEDKFYSILDENSITSYVSDGKTFISIKVSEEFLVNADNYSEEMSGDLIIVAKDWLDNGGNIRSEFQGLTLPIKVRYANGTVKNRFTIKDENDLLKIKDNLSAHYKISTTIDVANISNQLPLGELKGSIVGTNEYALITNLTISNSLNFEDGNNIYQYYGLFSKLSDQAYIEYVQFEGSFDINANKEETTSSIVSYIGLIAGENNGSLINVGVKLNKSQISIQNGHVGGVVGTNNGQILQDYTLFEDLSSNTRSYKANELKNLGRFSYEGKNPYVNVQMTDYLTIDYIVGNDISKYNRIGGLVGFNTGLIKKIDSKKVTFNGYSNYMAYSLIKSQPSNSRLSSIARTFIGGLVGESIISNSNNSKSGLIIAGTNIFDDKSSLPIYTPYSNYKTDTDIAFEAGEGIIVGGDVWGYGYVGGVVGNYQNLSAPDEFVGITARTSIRGQKLADGLPANIAIIANIKENVSGGLSTAFAIQAVDAGKMGEESSMAVVYNGSKEELVNYLNDVNKLGFGNFENSIGSLKGYSDQTLNSTDIVNVFTYVISRKLEEVQKVIVDGVEKEQVAVMNSSKESYYGDFVIVGTDKGSTVVLAQKTFTKGTDENLSINAKFANLMKANKEKAKDVFFAYYFEVTSIDNAEDISGVQAELDSYLNKVNPNSSIYPFIANGEMIFNSKTPDVLTIDQIGRLTIKKTGLALISATSLLNTNNALNFYIYVVNYFNPETLIAENQDRNSIVYNDSSASSTPVDQSDIQLRGNNSAEIFVRPRYDLLLEVNKDIIFNSDKFGRVVNFKGLTFNLANNTEVTAQVDEIEELDISVLGQSIIIRKNDKTTETKYTLKISPVLKLLVEENAEEILYHSQVNKLLDKTQVSYQYGAININNKNYNSVPIQTSKSVSDEIYINSTSSEEKTPIYYIVGLNGQTIQSSQETSNDNLFNVKFKKLDTFDTGNGIFKNTFKLDVSINSQSSIYTDRYNKEIYGKYLLYIQAESNTDMSICIALEFERTQVSMVTIDNYKSLNEMDNSLTTTSEYAYPGESGLLQITLSPEDSDFDYVVIENDEQNYVSGNATSTFSLLSRKIDVQGTDSLFENSIIIGASTSKGIKLTQDEIIKAYSKKDGENNLYYQYNGVIYLRYDMSSKNVLDLSSSKINLTFYKDGKVIYTTHKTLKIKLKHFVGIKLEDKEGQENQNGYYMLYTVARGLKYKINIESFGYKQENIKIRSSNENLGQITLEGKDYYLNITNDIVNYANENNKFDLIVEANQAEGDNSRYSESKTKITVMEYVLNYNNELHGDKDIVVGAGNGIINVQVGSQIEFKLDLFDFVEYDVTNTGVVASIEKFFSELAINGEWKAITNLISDDQPDYNKAPSEEKLDETSRQVYYLGKDKSVKNYYFNSNGLNVQPIRTHMPEESFYYFVYSGKFVEQNGGYIYNEESNNTIKTSFMLNVYSTSSEESPIPVYDYEDLCNMQKDGYYILLNDITLPNADDESKGIKKFTPLNGNFASFDGNGHAINFAGAYDMGNISEIGLFSSLDESSQIKNLIVNYSSALDGSDYNNNPNDTTYGLYGYKTVKFITSADAFVFGSIVAENSGIITNCQVFCEETATDEYYLSVKADNALTGLSYIGGIAGRNNGFITNCGASLNIKAPFNIGGVVAQNYNKVAGCYFKEGKLINNSQFAQYVGGFAVTNSNDGRILTSYVAGKQSSNSLYSQDTDSCITATIIGAGFIVENEGNINDCYTDIDLSKTTAEMAGFVYKNSGFVKNCFSLSKLRNNTTASAGFVKQNTVSDENNKSFSNCYYFIDKDNKINTSLFAQTFDGVKPLTKEGFANFEENFSTYSYQKGLNVNAIWFTTDGSTSSNFVEYIPTTQKVVIKTEEDNKENESDNNKNEGNIQSNTLYETKVMEFGLNRLELVNPNVRVLSVRNFAYSEMDQTTGNVTYFYNDDNLTPNKGTLHNPRLLYNADSMESEIINQTATTNLNVTNYRLISDISYSEFEGHSALYNVKFAGVFEGNGMRISNISLVSMEDLESAGLFAQIGNSASKTGSVKNLFISPKAVSFNNADSVGILAGTIKYGYIYDITTDEIQGFSSTVTGLKFVGGIFGRAVSSFEIKDIYSSVNVSANYSPERDNPYLETSASSGEYSYAGSIGGFVGKGKLYNAHVTNVNSVMGGRAGFAYGGIGKGADVKYTFVDVVSGSTIKAYQYGGYISGEVGGNLYYSYVSDNGNNEYSFANVPKVAIAVGGIAGRFNGGTIKEALMQQSFNCSSNENNQTINYVGGLVGIVSAEDSTLSRIQDCVVDADILAGSTLGGGVGRIASATQINGLAIKSQTLSIKGQRANPCLGGVIGEIAGISGASLDMTNSYCNADINIETYTSGIQSTARAGGLIGFANIMPYLYYCYTTSKINAIVYDSRQVNDLIDFNMAYDEKYEEYNEHCKYRYDYFTNNCNNVYYWGKNLENVGDSDDDKEEAFGDTEKNVYDSNYVSFKTKAKSVDIKLSVSNFGTPSTQFAGTNITQSSLNNIFGKSYQIKDYDDSVLELTKINDKYSSSTQNFEYDPESKNYYWEDKKDSENFDSIDDLRVFNQDADVLHYYMKGNEKFMYSTETEAGESTTTTKHILTSLTSGKEYLYSVVTDNTESASTNDATEITFVKDAESINLSDLVLRLEFNEENLTHKTVYLADNGNYYSAELDSTTFNVVYKDIKTGQAISENDKITILSKVWKSNSDEYSTLTIEDSFDWLEML